MFEEAKAKDAEEDKLYGKDRRRDAMREDACLGFILESVR